MSKIRQATDTVCRSRISRVLTKARSTLITESRGKVTQLAGLVIESEGPLAAVGDVCRILSNRDDSHMLAEVVGFRNHRLLLMPYGEIHGIQPGSQVISTGGPLQINVSDDLLGRTINAFGEPLDEGGSIDFEHRAPVHVAPPHPLKRQRIEHPFRTGVKAIDSMTPVGKGQRMGIFAGSGVGKSTLLGMIAGHAEADVNVIALIGERGREVREFLEKELSPESRRRTVVVVATSNEPALARLEGAFVATDVLMKCPSKYKDEEIYLKEQQG